MSRLNQCFLNLGDDPLQNMEKIIATGREILHCELAKYWRLEGKSYSLTLALSGCESYRPRGTSLERKILEEFFLWHRGPLGWDKDRLPRIMESDPDIGEYGLKSLLSHPVMVGSEFVGCLCLFDGRERHFSDEEVGYMGMLARALSIEEARWRDEEDLRDFIDIASHELRHPITLVKGYAITLAEFEDRLSKGEKKDMLAKINQAADRLTFILNELLDVTRIERGKLTLSIREVPVAAVVESALAELGERYEGRGFEVHLGEKVGTFSVDPGKVTFVLSALLDNAAKFSPPDTPITLEVERVEDEVVISVLDRGPGIPEGEEERVFERFYHAGKAVYHSIPGIGLGLYLAKMIINAHGGRIWYKSREGGGSVFTFTLPVGSSSERV
ncbi:GAF domain-containing sensor histidine kinase [Candidatus Solincola sp.]|nr:ATP-binding protein [Actinomycetota bacterium]